MNTRSKSKSIQQKNKLREITTGFYKIFLESLQDKVVRNKLAYWYYQGNKQKGQPDISEIIKTSTGTVRSRLHYAKQQLQSYLQDYIT